MRAAEELQAAKHRLEESEKSLRELSRHLLRTQDEERRRIGRDLHDSLGQYLSALKMKLASLNSTVGQNAKVQQEIDECMDLALILLRNRSRTFELFHTCYILQCSNNLV
jgi:signal transduction histidine kinase